jgi:hypothetical protein
LSSAEGLLGPPASAAQAGLQALAVAAFLLAFGFALTSGLLYSHARSIATRAALALPALLGYVLLLGCLHWATGGRIFSNPSLVRAITLVVFLAAILIWLARIRLSRQKRSLDRAALTRASLLLLTIVAAAGIWSIPNWHLLPLDHSGDTPVHAAWAEQLLNGARLPSGFLSGYIPNYYPWLYHFLLAFIACFTPGGTAYHAMGPLQVQIAVGSACAYFGLGRWMTGRNSTAWGAALLGSMTGGFGYFVIHGAHVVTNIRDQQVVAHGIGDFLFKRSYNLAFANIAPPFPRDLAFVFLPVVLMLLLAGFRTKNYSAVIGAGVATGLMGLTGYETFFATIIVGAVATMAFPGELRRLRAVAAFILPAIALWCLWVIPLFVGYLRYGGFNKIASPPVSLPAGYILGSWGITTPLAIVGLLWLRRLRDPAVLLPLTLIAVTGAIIALPAGVTKLVGPGFQTLLRDHRFWPLIYGGLALFGALGVTTLVGFAHVSLQHFGRNPARIVAILILVAITALAIPSPLLAGTALPRQLEPNPLLTSTLTGSDTWLAVLDSGRPEDRNVAVPQSVEHLVSAYTGYRELVFYWATNNFGHQRFKDLIRLLGGEAPRVQANTILTTGNARPEVWRQLAAKWQIDRVVVPLASALAPGFRGCPRLQTPAGSPFIVILASDCRSKPVGG